MGWLATGWVSKREFNAASPPAQLPVPEQLVLRLFPWRAPQPVASEPRWGSEGHLRKWQERARSHSPRYAELVVAADPAVFGLLGGCSDLWLPTTARHQLGEGRTEFG